MKIKSFFLKETNQRKLKYYASYTFGLSLKKQKKYCFGWIVSPKWVDNLISDFNKKNEIRPILLDNGAFTAWKLNKKIPCIEHIELQKKCYQKIIANNIKINGIIIPDTVGDGKDTLKKIEVFQQYKYYDNTIAFACIQENMNIDVFLNICNKNTFGIFIGGKSKEWKYYIIKQIKEKKFNGKIHFGRASTDLDLYICSKNKIDSFDNSTYMNGLNRKNLPLYIERLKKYAIKK